MVSGVKMDQKITKSILPFSTPSESRQESFGRDVERAAIFCLAEQKRETGGGILLKQPEEKMDFIAEVCYPFWLVSIQGVSLLFDGLITTSQTLTYPQIPDIRSFMDNLGSCKTREVYSTFLSDNINYFQVLGNEEEKEVDGLITDRDFLAEFVQLLTESTSAEDSLSSRVTISPTLDQSSLTSTMEEIEDLKSRFEGEVDLLYQSMKLVKAKTQKFLKDIREEIKRIQESFSEKVEKSKAAVGEKVGRIREEYDQKVTEYTKKAEEVLVDLQQEKIKLEKKKEKLAEEIEHCEAEIKTCAVNQDQVGKRKWKERTNELKEELSEIETELEELNGKIKEARDEKKHKIFDLKSERDEKIKEADEGLVEIESSRDAKIEIYKEEMEKFEELAPNIIEQIDKLVKLRGKAIDEFRKLGIPQKQERRELFYLPFYLTCYKSNSEKRYLYFPPSIVQSVSFSVKFKGALGRGRINQLLHPRFEKVDSLLSEFLLLLEKNPVFNREVDEACNEVDILRTEESRESIKTGLKKLKEEDWLTEKEYETFHQELEQIK